MFNFKNIYKQYNGQKMLFFSCDLGRTPVVLLLPGSPSINIQAIYLELVLNVFKNIVHS